MEDYASARIARNLDLEVLLAATPPRTTLAVHVGGIATECQLKALTLSYHKIARWEEDGRRPKEALYGKPIPRPGHHLLSVLKMMSKVYDRAKADHLFLRHLDRLMHPAGSRDADFIDLRYFAGDLEGITLADWRDSLKYVAGWLKKNGPI